MLSNSAVPAKASTHDVPRTVHIIVHAKIFSFSEGWNELRDEQEIFQFDAHAFNFDYLLHLSGINYLIHPDDVDQVIAMVQGGFSNLIEFNLRFINRVGEVKSINGLVKLVERS